MNSPELPAIAVIADAHYHDMDSDYGLKATPLAGRQATLRSWQDSRRSSRVFNESVDALRTALDGIEQRGIRHVVLLGDYTDDGQREATARLLTLLQDYRQRFGMAFYAIPGNHDCYGPHGKHQSTRFVTVPGETTLVTSDPDIAATEDKAILTAAMFCDGTPVGLQSMADFGLCRQAGYRHWETPFGSCDSLETRLYEARSDDGTVRRQLLDASYLVEPVDGLWLLMLDANVFEPRNGKRLATQKRAFIDASDAGWNAVLRQRPHLLPWITDVCTRARTQGKQLLGFSHYPLMDPFDDSADSESRLFGHTDMYRRRPSTEVARTLAHAGLTVHLGGHLHVNGYQQMQFGQQQLIDIAVPSLVAFPAAYAIINPSTYPSTYPRGTYPSTGSIRIETVPLSQMPLDPALMNYYRAEVQASGAPDDLSLQARHYGEFLYRRMHCRTQARHLAREWPADLAQAVPGSHAADLALFLLAQQLSVQPLRHDAWRTIATAAEADSATEARAETDTVPDTETSRETLHSMATLQLAALCHRQQLTPADLGACPLDQLITDWYCLRQGGHQACSFFTPGHLNVYLFLARHFGNLSVTEIGSQADWWRLFLGVLQQSLQRAVPGMSLNMALPVTERVTDKVTGSVNGSVTGRATD